MSVPAKVHTERQEGTVHNKLTRSLFVVLQIVLVTAFCYEQFKYNSSIYGNDLWVKGVLPKVFGDSALFVLPVVFCACCSFVIAPTKLPWIKSLLLLGSEAYLIRNGGSYLGFGVLVFYLFNMVIIVAMIIDCIVNSWRALDARNASEPSS
jgi:hypothetical protein